jgi:hypothetical protein
VPRDQHAERRLVARAQPLEQPLLADVALARHRCVVDGLHREASYRPATAAVAYELLTARSQRGLSAAAAHRGLSVV